jgi:hypothetical protein
MYSFYFKLVFSFTVLFMTLNIAVRALGYAQPTNPALAGFTTGCEGKLQPCWYGIVPGETTVAEAEVMLAAHEYTLLNVRNGSDIKLRATSALSHCPIDLSMTILSPKELSTITRITVACEHIKLGDVTPYMGAPHSAKLCFAPAEFQYDNAISLRAQDTFDSFSAFMPVTLVFRRPSGDPAHPNRWHGMMPIWRYKQIEQLFASYGCG